MDDAKRNHSYAEMIMAWVMFRRTSLICRYCKILDIEEFGLRPLPILPSHGQ